MCFACKTAQSTCRTSSNRKGTDRPYFRLKTWIGVTIKAMDPTIPLFTVKNMIKVQSPTIEVGRWATVSSKLTIQFFPLAFPMKLRTRLVTKKSWLISSKILTRIRQERSAVEKSKTSLSTASKRPRKSRGLRKLWMIRTPKNRWRQSYAIRSLPSKRGLSRRSLLWTRTSSWRNWTHRSPASWK